MSPSLLPILQTLYVTKKPCKSMIYMAFYLFIRTKGMGEISHANKGV